MLIAAKHANPRARIRADDFVANSHLAPQPRDISPFVRHLKSSQSTSARRADGFAGFALDELLAILDSLALVRLRRSETANFGRRLAEQLAIGAAESDDNLAFDRCRHALRQRKHHRMRIAQSHVNFLASDFGAVTDAIDIEHTAKSLAHPLRHVGDQLARQPVQRADLAVIVAARSMRTTLPSTLT